VAGPTVLVATVGKERRREGVKCMECKEVLILLWEYLDQELNPEETAAVAAHLSRCGGCYPAYCYDRALLQLLARQRTACWAPAALVVSVRANLGLS
jgi:anti-sigma factor RsiW